MIRNIYTTAFDKMNCTDSFLNPVSLTIPDDSLSVQELFQRHVAGILDRDKALLERKLKFDGWNPGFEDWDDTEESSDIVEAYERAWSSDGFAADSDAPDDDKPAGEQRPVEETDASHSTDSEAES
ncbi:hypothetical protein [Sigmofec virus UA08Rod_6396]|uniref:Uncharacterized protein n=1 Tax=Sigmofec virus UA08Rod_6396 TaxID=2929227 RepID=A0A976N1Q3_9VIRU|nr:hypothetical protein [Sigmofec virus UA08Rod_6396]